MYIEYLKIFIISSSFLVFLITFLYLGISYKINGRPNNIPYEMIVIIVPLLFGIFGIINYYIIKKYNDKNYSIIVGLIFGLLLSLIGRFYLKLPSKLFKLKNENIVHIIAMIIYGFIFRVILSPIYDLFDMLN